MPNPPTPDAVEIHAIQAHQTHPLRHEVLRPHQPMAQMAYPGDDAPETRHLGAFIQGQLVGIASLYKEFGRVRPLPGDWRLRGMAVDPEMQGRGIGKALVEAALAAIQQACGQRLWCNARTTACGFYEAQGLRKAGDPFDLPGIGEHYVMWIGAAMSHPPFIILGYSEASMLLRDADQNSQFAACVSISGQRDPRLEFDGLKQLELRFDDSPSFDTNDALGAYRVREQRRKAKKIGLDLKPPTLEDAQAIIEFSTELRSASAFVLFQCFAGISRSSGAALLSVANWLGPGLENEAVKEVLDVRPAAQPHLGLVQFGDQLLGRDGKLLAALTHSQRKHL